MACLPALTPVAVEGDYKNIQALQVGELAIATGYIIGKILVGPALGAVAHKLAQPEAANRHH
jgi:hypothetical protein